MRQAMQKRMVATKVPIHTWVASTEHRVREQCIQLNCMAVFMPTSAKKQSHENGKGVESNQGVCNSEMNAKATQTQKKVTYISE